MPELRLQTIAATACLLCCSAAYAEEQTWVMGGFAAGRDGRVAELVELVTGSQLVIDRREPGALVHPFKLADAIADGSADIVVAPLALWQRDEPALALFTSVPFGPTPVEYLAWIAHGGGGDIHNELLAAKGVHGVPCAIEVPEASGWFREEVTSTDQFAGMKMRFFGLGGEVMRGLGVETVSIAMQEIKPAMESGEIDATEFSTPANDLFRGLHEVASHYYLPGWHQPSTLLELIVSAETWGALSPALQGQIEAACAANLMAELLDGEAKQSAALAEIEASGVQIHRWPDEMLKDFETAWGEVASAKSAENANFKRTLDSLAAFRADYAEWTSLSSVN